MPAPAKGKPPTKGAKQIVVENDATIHFYRNMALGTAFSYGLATFLFYYDSLTLPIIILNLLALTLHIVCYKAMTFMSKATFSDSGQLLDAGVDLNMEGGMGEHLKDIVILTSLTHMFAIASNYFWLLLLFIPLRAAWLLWKTVLGPWFFQEAPQDTEQDEKKKKKIERKMKRYQQ